MINIENVIGALENEGIAASVITVDKGNGLLLKGLQLGDGDVKPTLYFDETVGTDGDLIAGCKKAYANRDAAPDLTDITDYDSVKLKLSVRLYQVPPKDAIYRNCIGDLVVVPSIIFNDNMSAIVTKNEALLLGVDVDTIIDDAIENAKIITPSELIDLESFMLGMEDKTELGDIIVVTNEQKVNGASAILYAPIPFKRYYVLPSSKHEVIVVNGETDFDPSVLVNMVHEVNSNCVKEIDKLSDNVYYYDGQTYTTYR